MIDTSLEKRLRSLGLTAAYQGYYCILHAVRLVQQDPERLTLTTKLLYPDVARLCAQAPSSVDGAIRTAMRRCARQDPESMRALFGSEAPTVSHFLSTLARLSQQGGNLR